MSKRPLKQNTNIKPKTHHIDDNSSLYSRDKSLSSNISFVTDGNNIKRNVKILHPISNGSNLQPAPGGVSSSQYIVENRSLHELIEHIETNAKNKISSPMYVPTLQQILLNSKNTTWRNQKKIKVKTNKSDTNNAETVTGADVTGYARRGGDSGLSADVYCKEPPVLLPRQMSGNSMLSGVSMGSGMISQSSLDIPTSGIHPLPVDIIGCQHPVQLILYKANERARRITNVREHQHEIETSHKLSIEKSLQDRLTRLEIKSQTDRTLKQAKAWLTISHVLLSAHRLYNHPGEDDSIIVVVVCLSLLLTIPGGCHCMVGVFRLRHC